MKKIFYSILIGMLALSFGCEEPDEVEYTVADGFAAQNSPLTVLDDQATVSFSTANPDVSELTIEHLYTIHLRWDAEAGAVYYDTTDTGIEGFDPVSISDGSGSMTITRSDVGLEDNAMTGSWVEFASKANIEGNPMRTFSVGVSSAFDMVKGPYIWTTDKKGNPISPDVKVYHNDDVQYIKYNLVRNAETVSDMTLEEKIGANGTYSEVTSVDLNTDANDKGVIIDSIEVVGTETVGGVQVSDDDTVYYKFTATSSFNTESSVVEIPINELLFGETGTFTLDSVSGKAYDLVNNKMIMDTASARYDSADVAVNLDGAVLDITSSDSTEFYRTTNLVKGDMDNTEEVIAEYDSNTPVNTVNDVKDGDLILYKTYRNNTENYGSLIVEKAWINSSQDDYELTFTYYNN